MADKLYSLAVRYDWGNKCAVCGAGKCEAHHLIPRQHQKTRYDLRNGIALCPVHHKFDADISPHQNSAGWMLWLWDYRREVHDWYLEKVRDHQHRKFEGTTNAQYYCDVIRSLKQYVEEEDYERIVGVKFSQWLETSVDTDSEKE